MTFTELYDKAVYILEDDLREHLEKMDFGDLYQTYHSGLDSTTDSLMNDAIEAALPYANSQTGKLLQEIVAYDWSFMEYAPDSARDGSPEDLLFENVLHLLRDDVYSFVQDIITDIYHERYTEEGAA